MPSNDDLNERELETIRLLAEGLSNQEIADRLFLASSTVKWYIRQLNSKLGTNNRDEIIQQAYTMRLLEVAQDKSQNLSKKHHLPRQTTSFIGREAELDEIYTLLSNPDVRLLTILAPGGMGKTRIALEAAEQQFDHFADGVYFVELAPLGTFDDQLLSSLLYFIHMLRSGYSVTQCFENVSSRAPEPTASAFRAVVSDFRTGMTPLMALEKLRAEVGSTYFDRVIDAMITQFHEGGNLADRLDVITDGLRTELGDKLWLDKVDYAEQLIVRAIAGVVGYRFQQGETSEKQQLLDFLADQNMLLVIDNWEHLLDGVPLVNQIIQAAPQIKVLATSRERLNITGETIYLLHGMTFPTWETPEDALQYDAVKLLLQAARYAQPDWNISADNLDHVARVCRLTEGMPLGILLAASWLDVLSLEEIAAEIQRSVDFLETEMRDVPQRQRSIRAIFDATWQRMSPDEQQGFMKFSHFRGGFTREAAQAVGANLRTLQSLVNKALVMRGKDGRYDLHELLRQYALEKLSQSGEADMVKMRHAQFYLAMVEQAERRLHNADSAHWFDQIRAEDDNIRSVLSEFLRHETEAGIAMRIASALWHFWANEARYNEGLDWLKEMAPRADNQPPALRAKVLHALGTLNTYLMNWSLAAEQLEVALELARLVDDQWICAHIMAWLGRANVLLPPAMQAQYMEESLHLARKLNDPWLIGTCLRNHGRYLCQLYEFDRANLVLQEALAIAQEMGLPLELGLVLIELGETAALQGDLLKAKTFIMQGIDYMRQSSNGVLVADGLGDLSDVERLLGEYELARTNLEEVLRIWQKQRNPVRESRVLFKLGFVAFHQNRMEDAEALFRQSMTRAVQHLSRNDMVRSIGMSFVGLAKIAAERHEWIRALTLVSIGQAQFQAVQRTFSQSTPADRDEALSLISLLQNTLDKTTFDKYSQEGEQMPLDQAVAYALAH